MSLGIAVMNEEMVGLWRALRAQPTIYPQEPDNCHMIKVTGQKGNIFAQNFGFTIINRN